VTDCTDGQDEAGGIGIGWGWGWGCGCRWVHQRPKSTLITDKINPSERRRRRRVSELGGFHRRKRTGLKNTSLNNKNSFKN